MARYGAGAHWDPKLDGAAISKSNLSWTREASGTISECGSQSPGCDVRQGLKSSSSVFAVSGPLWSAPPPWSVLCDCSRWDSGYPVAVDLPQLARMEVERSSRCSRKSRRSTSRRCCFRAAPLGSFSVCGFSWSLAAAWVVGFGLGNVALRVLPHRGKSRGWGAQPPSCFRLMTPVLFSLARRRPFRRLRLCSLARCPRRRFLL
jgi:hypothetical protein